MRSILLTVIIFCFTTLYLESKAQNAVSSTVLNKYYSNAELDSIENSAPSSYAAILYYFNNSYKVEAISCTDCLPFDPSLFDVFEYEKMREADVDHTRAYEKQGLFLQLFAYSKLAYPVPEKMIELKRQKYTRNVLVKPIE